MAPKSPPHARSGPGRLVFLLQDLKFGGTQRQTLELARRLDPGEFQVEVWCLAEGDDLGPLARERGLHPEWLSRARWVTPGSLAQLWRQLIATPIDLLLLLTPVPNIWGRILGRLAGVPLIVGNCRDQTQYRQHEELLWPLAHHILCNAAAVQQLLVTRYRVSARRISVIPNGVDTDFFRPPASPSAGPPLVLTVGRLVPDKDHETLIRAFRLVLRDHPQAKLVLVGDGRLKEATGQLLERCLPPGRACLLPGRSDLRPLLQRASLFALSSVTESLPNVVLEAMASGLPVVATSVGGLPELVETGETGWLVPARNVPALAAALSQVLGAPDSRRAFGQAGREKAVREFSLDVMVGRYEKLFQHLLASASKMKK